MHCATVAHQGQFQNFNGRISCPTTAQLVFSRWCMRISLLLSSPTRMDDSGLKKASHCARITGSVAVGLSYNSIQKSFHFFLCVRTFDSVATAQPNPIVANILQHSCLRSTTSPLLLLVLNSALWWWTRRFLALRSGALSFNVSVFYCIF